MDGRNYAKRHRMQFMETSVQTREGVQSVFEELAEKVRFVSGR